MANIRQYIGARYTIKIHENSQDASSAEWEANTSYEPLVMVTYNNSSYLSKKDVPATIGNPAQNPTYWIVTGAYNGQIAALQAQIDAINNNELPAITAQIQSLSDTVSDIAYTKLNGKRIVIITDSYGEVTANFIERMQSQCPELETGVNFFPFAYGGAGFVATSGYSWQEKFVNSGDIDTVTNPNTITDVLVLGGSNDRGTTIAIGDIMSAGQTLYNSLKTKFTNANIYVGYIGYSVNYLSGDYAPIVKQAYQDLGAYGYRPIAHANSWLHYTGYISDNVHPTASGSRLIATGVLNTIIGGGEDDIFNNRPTTVPVTMETGFTSTNLTSRLYTYHYGHRSALKIVPASFTFTSASLLFNGTWQKFATIGDTFLYGANDNYHLKLGAIHCTYNGTEYTMPAMFKLFNKGLYIYCYPNGELQGTEPITISYVGVMLDGFEADDIFM